MSASTGNGSRLISVSSQLIDNMSVSAKENATALFTEYITAGPIIDRTASMSFVVREITSPDCERW